MNCTHCPNCPQVAPLSSLVPEFARQIAKRIAALWRSALASLAQLG